MYVSLCGHEFYRLDVFWFCRPHHLKKSKKLVPWGSLVHKSTLWAATTNTMHSISNQMPYLTSQSHAFSFFLLLITTRVWRDERHDKICVSSLVTLSDSIIYSEKTGVHLQLEQLEVFSLSWVSLQQAFVPKEYFGSKNLTTNLRRPQWSKPGQTSKGALGFGMAWCFLTLLIKRILHLHWSSSALNLSLSQQDNFDFPRDVAPMLPVCWDQLLAPTASTYLTLKDYG